MKYNVYAIIIYLDMLSADKETLAKFFGTTVEGAAPDSRGRMSYETWSIFAGLKDLVAEGGQAAVIPLTALLVETGPLAPILAEGIVLLGSKVFDEIIDIIPHMDEKGDQAGLTWDQFITWITGGGKAAPTHFERHTVEPAPKTNRQKMEELVLKPRPYALPDPPVPAPVMQPILNTDWDPRSAKNPVIPIEYYKWRVPATPPAIVTSPWATVPPIGFKSQWYS